MVEIGDVDVVVVGFDVFGQLVVVVGCVVIFQIVEVLVDKVEIWCFFEEILMYDVV